MSDRDTVIQDELELITEFLHQRLDPVRAEEVYQRLERDPEFLELATPLLFAWSVKPEWERPEKVAEAEKHWEEFTRRADFTHHRKRRIRRNWWIAGIVVATLGTASFLLREQAAKAYLDWRDYATVAPDTGWISLRQHIQARLEPGARLRMARTIQNDAQYAKLEGTAHFRVKMSDTAEVTKTTPPLIVRTAGGEVVAGLGDFTVSVAGDTTIVEVLPAQRRFLYMALPSMIMVQTEGYDPLVVRPPSKVRLVRDRAPERLP